ncbi:MAG: hypothetical protein DMF26_01910 [Verrucomicrobia bacterium]|nr:MAG: hypothetical protein DMF26_01910 [Verrucomicrobiota bacterium]
MRARTLMLKPSLPLQIFNPKPTDLMKTPIQSITAMAKPLLGRPVMLLLLSVSAGLASMQPCAATPFQWEYTRSLKTERSDHTAILLPDGRVLVASGQHLPGILRSAELYNPSTAHWNRTGKLYNPRYDHTATLLSNGTVLVAGGAQLSFGIVACESMIRRAALGPGPGTSTLVGLNTQRPCWPMARCCWQADSGRAAGTDSQRGTVRSGHRNLDPERQPQYCPRSPHSHLARQW